MLAVPAHRALVEEAAARQPGWLGQFLEYACSRLEPEHFAGVARLALVHLRPE